MSSAEQDGDFTKGDVAADFVDAIDVRLFDRALGWTRPLELYSWPEGSGDDGWPFVVVRDGRTFEVNIDVRVTELTPERLIARIEAELARKIDPTADTTGE